MLRLQVMTILICCCIALQPDTAAAQAEEADEARPEKQRWALGAAGTIRSFLGEAIQTGPFVGARLWLSHSLHQKVSVAGGVGRSLPAAENLELPGSLRADGTAATVPVTRDLAVWEVDVSGRYHFVGKSYDPSTFYGLIGASLLWIDSSIGYDDARYDLSYLETDSTSAGFMLIGGLGFRWTLGNLALLAETSLALPANEVNGEAVQVEVPAYAMGQLGVGYAF